MQAAATVRLRAVGALRPLPLPPSPRAKQPHKHAPTSDSRDSSFVDKQKIIRVVTVSRLRCLKAIIYLRKRLILRKVYVSK